MGGGGKNIAAERFNEGRPCRFVQPPSAIRQAGLGRAPAEQAGDQGASGRWADRSRGGQRLFGDHPPYRGASEAHRVYANETEKAVIGGCGWWRVKSAYCDDADFDQDLGIEGIANPNSVACDPDARTRPVRT
jgi:hypothetical protein